MQENTNESRRKWKEGWSWFTLFAGSYANGTAIRFNPDNVDFVYNGLYNNMDWLQYFCNPKFNTR